QVDIRGRQAGLAQAPAGGLGRLLPGRERHRPLAVLAAAETLLFGGGHHHAVDHERGRRIVEDGVNAEHTHAYLPSLTGFRGSAVSPDRQAPNLARPGSETA